MLKCDFHIHTKEDPKDFCKIKYNSFQMIDFAAKKGFDVLAITLHKKLYFNKKIQEYAKSKGILLIPGIEAMIEHQDFVILFKKPDYAVEKIKTYEELKKYKAKNEKNILIIVPHLFYPKYFPKSNKRFDVADAFEFSHFYLRWFNPNKKAVVLAKKLNKAVVGNSDMHMLCQMDHTFTLIDCKKDIDSIFAKIKKNDVSVITKPFFSKTLIFLINFHIFNLFKKRKFIK